MADAPGPPDAPDAAAIAALQARGRFGIRLGLGRTRALLRALGSPESALRGVLIGGTNGKGSTQAMVASALRAARELEFGGVTVNEAPTFRADQMPYGGVKDSGNTREGPAFAVRELTEDRLVVIEL